MTKPSGPMLRRDLRRYASGTSNMGSEMLLLGGCIASGLLGMYFQDVRVMCTLFLGGMGVWLALSVPSALQNLKDRAAAQVKSEEAAVDAVRKAPALPGPESVMALIKARRSVFPKDYTGGKVTKEQIEQLLEASNWAPTHHLTQPWRFVVLEGDSKKQFEDLTIACVEKYSPPEKAAAAVEKLKGKAAKTWPLVSHYIAICMARVSKPGSKPNPEWEDLSSVACAVQNMHLLATSMGLSGYWSSWQAAARDSQDMAEFLGLDMAAGDKCYGVFSLGVSERAGSYRGSRSPAMDKVTWKS